MDDSWMSQVLTEGRALHSPQVVMVSNSRCTQFLWHPSFTVKLISCSGFVRCLLYRFLVSATYGVSKACIIRDVRTGCARCVCCTFARMNLIGALEPTSCTCGLRSTRTASVCWLTRFRFPLSFRLRVFKSPMRGFERREPYVRV